MADEQADRLYKRKRLRDPNDPLGAYYIDVPVIYRATFKTMAEQAQERNWYVDNSEANEVRRIRVQTVRNPNDQNMRIDVERIQSIDTKTMAEQAQEHRWFIVNDDPPPAVADGETLIDDPSHEKKHFVRYQGRRIEAGEPVDEPEAWVDIELIDTLKIHCAAEQHQDYLLYPRWPRPEDQDAVGDAEDPFQPLTLAICPEDLELIEGPQTTPAGNKIDPPYRLDPFQNIVNIHWPAPSTGIGEQVFIFRRYASNPNPLTNGDWYPVEDDFWETQSLAGRVQPLSTIINPGSTAQFLLFNLETIATRPLRSALITACMTLSNQYSDPPNTSGGDPGGGWNARVAWLNSNSGPQMTTTEPASVENRQYVYFGVKGTYASDDLGTGDLDTIISGIGHPAFTPI